MITLMTNQQLCVLGCRSNTGEPFPAQHGYLTCDRCTGRLFDALRELVGLYGRLAGALMPGAATTGTRGSPGYGSRSPARDGVLALTDARTVAQDEGDPHSVLEILASWADNVREDTGMVPRDITAAERRDVGRLLGWLDWTSRQRWARRIAARVAELRDDAAALVGLQERTVSSEAGLLLRWMDHITRQYWVADFADEVHELHHQVRAALGELERSVLIGTCRERVHDPDTGRPRRCGQSLRASLASERITCRGCRASWPRDRWDELGDALGTPLSDVASLSVWLSVPAGTLRRWRSEDQWTRHGTRSRPLYARADVLASWQQRRGTQARSA
jgi:hypothetical protein